MLTFLIQCSPCDFPGSISYEANDPSQGSISGEAMRILNVDCRYRVNRKRIQRLMRQMDLRALYPRRRTSQPGQGHKIYPTCSGTCPSSAPNQAWASDICYIPMAKGFMYLVVIMDW